MPFCLTRSRSASCEKGDGEMQNFLRTNLCFLLALLMITGFPLAAYAQGDMRYFSGSDYNDVSSEVPNAVITLEGEHGTISDPTLGTSGNPVLITRKGVYRITGSGENVSILVNDEKESGNIYLILDRVSMKNEEACIRVEGADAVIIQCVGDNTLISTAPEKGTIFSRDDLTINGSGSLTIESGNNGIHCNDDLRITGAEISVRAINDGVKANDGIYMDGGSLTVSLSYEGLEAGAIVIQGGEISVTAGDDGINVSAENGDVIISGGSIYINSGGDGIDSNHSIFVEGGVILMEGPENSRNSLFDKGDNADAVLSISGGTVLAAGSSAKAKNFDTGSQCSVLMEVKGQPGDTISVDDGSGISLTAGKSFTCILYSSPTFTSDNTVNIS